MKNKIILFSLIFTSLGLVQGCFSSGTYQVTGGQNNNYQDNSYQNNSTYPEYNVDDLNQYGYWQDVYPYGRCWRPSVVADWTPFTNGHWAYDGSNWVWVSYEPFGWIVYHYGNWENTPDYGWVWIPSDDQWSPARVQWFDYGDQVGWAPLRPDNRSWPEPWENGGGKVWTVVRLQDFTNEDIHTYKVVNVNHTDNNIRIEHRVPEVKTVQQYVRQPIQVVRINRVPVVTPPASTTRNQSNPPVSNNNPPRVNPPVQNNNPPRGNPPVTTNPGRKGVKQIYNIQIPPQEKVKVDRNRPKVEKNVLVKKDPGKQQQNNNQKQRTNEKQNSNKDRK
ncbi:MAG: hypothetical protein P4L27_12380 [Ignavibacteriaceae bacterium]|nr:hypothetical protein [Ignavibacteriaceae bacterium]